MSIAIGGLVVAALKSAAIGAITSKLLGGDPKQGAIAGLTGSIGGSLLSQGKIPVASPQQPAAQTPAATTQASPQVAPGSTTGGTAAQVGAPKAPPTTQPGGLLKKIETFATEHPNIVRTVGAGVEGYAKAKSAEEERKLVSEEREKEREEIRRREEEERLRQTQPIRAGDLDVSPEAGPSYENPFTQRRLLRPRYRPLEEEKNAATQ
jgi:uncharacterized SAM-binding protein YcdF (DUF218 family)